MRWVRTPSGPACRPLSERSTDNLPNPETQGDDPYLPGNAPAIGDLMGLFDFGHRRDSSPALP